ncbi:MAG TPA: fumarylacetoacetate hydrolase family protein [Spirochaetota bacterium]|nr:fumarylacetoacetate hydrolase family protein [Spirochaetota bacterium]HOS32069.1 fumarylacetoacetate hydrolase family protein [Spirochaetota bacterium]HOS55410.1 fumarylacetoacetate hydrolase family protein [Spirochaetota bacterium]HPK62979.1 fumarylacetoacetate hydrolase family protein [Spirochaetota bacterium]HQF76858.1 fumarylacetoacetate hydrolase family protein [Spirochaetota bacterium]
MKSSIYNPTKIVCVGLNYREHAKELGFAIPTSPILFMKPLSSIIYNNQPIVIPSISNQVDYEAELAIIIGKKCKNISKDASFDYIKGYSCLNDVTARDLQQIDGQWTRAKSFDTFCPIGPDIVQVKDPNNLEIQCRLNGKTVQRSNTNDFIFNVQYLVSFISQVMTLEGGDIIATGTPFGVGRMKEGDIVEVEIEQIGILKNNVVK